VRLSIFLVSSELDQKTKEIQSFLEQKGYTVHYSNDPRDGTPLMIWCLGPDQKSNLELIRNFKNRHTTTKLILIAHSWTKDALLEAFRMGTYDCFEQPVDLQNLGDLVVKCLKQIQHEESNQQLIKHLKQRFETHENGSHLHIVGEAETISTESILSYTKIKKKWMEHFEKEYLISTLIKYRGNVSAAARNAQLDRSNFLRLLRKYGLQAQGYRKAA
jgi:DNA-binding NtrC family response regulator